MTTQSVRVTATLPVRHQAIGWHLAAGLVGADIGTSVFYSTSVLVPHVGFMAPFFITIVCAAMWLFKTTYQEGTSVSPLNGGAYSMVLQTLGRQVALVVGSLTILSYLATAVVSALSGAFYLSSLWPEGAWPIWLVALVAAIPILVFAVLNLFGLKESTRLVFGIAIFHFAMLIAMDLWGLLVALTQGAHWERLGQAAIALSPQGAILGFASAFLGITGFESAAQIVEEVERPTHVNIRKVYLTIVLLVSFTAPVSSLLCLVLLPDADLIHYKDNLLSGLAMHLGGRPMLIALVMNACLTLFAAVNTAYAGATGLMTTMGKQGNLPAQVLAQWSRRIKAFTGYPYIALPFALLCIGMLAAFPGSVETLGSVYGMAFLGVMVSYCVGVVLLRVLQPHKVARSAYIARWTMPWRGARIPLAAVIGGLILLVSEVILVISQGAARDLGVQMFLAVLLLMAFYRLNQVESRMVRLPDLRLGLGLLQKLEKLPDDLPTYVVCTSGAHPQRLVTLISYLLKAHGPDYVEIVLFHAETDQQGRGVVSESLERLVSQQLEDFFRERDFILSVKVLPGNLVEVLPEYQKGKRIDRIYISQGRSRTRSEEIRSTISNETGLEVVCLEESRLPKGPAAWFTQWAQDFRRTDGDLPTD